MDRAPLLLRVSDRRQRIFMEIDGRLIELIDIDNLSHDQRRRLLDQEICAPDREQSGAQIIRLPSS